VETKGFTAWIGIEHHSICVQNLLLSTIYCFIFSWHTRCIKIFFILLK